MATWFARPQPARDDRYVQQCRVQGYGRMSRERIAFLLEEALRLVSLPHENEGRIYYFRKVSVTELSARASRQTWTNVVQTALVELASQAIHGASDLAGSADAVFFYNQQEALQLLLARILRREPLNRWFWPLVNRTAIEATRSERILAIIESLRELPASWLAVADAVLTAVGHGDPATLLSLLPQATVNSWLRELATAPNNSASARPVRLPQALEVMLRRSMRTMGGDDLRVLWLAALAVLRVAPSELSRGAVDTRAQSTLQSLAAPSLPNRKQRESIFQYQVQPGIEDHPVDSAALEHTSMEPIRLPLQRIEFDHGNVPSAMSETLLAESLSFEDAGKPRSNESSPQVEGGLLDHFFASAPTRAAGLYFLLNVLRRLGIAEAIEHNPVADESGLVARILQRLAAYAGVETGDPILRWIDLTLSQVEGSDLLRTDYSAIARSKLFPSNLLPSSQDIFDMEYFSRAWSVAVRRWCWRVGGLTMREVVLRSGRVSLSRSDLDVNLSLDSVDIRIRRVGLDIDPGWLSWFGRVVRFHYSWNEPAAEKWQGSKF